MKSFDTKIADYVGKYQFKRLEIGTGDNLKERYETYFKHTVEGLFSRSGLIFDFHRYRIPVQHRHDHDDIRIACVASDLRIFDPPKAQSRNDRGKAFEDATQKASYDLHEPELRLATDAEGHSTLRPTSAFSFEKWKDRRIAELKAALATKPDVICFSEFAYPTPVSCPGGKIETEYGEVKMTFQSGVSRRKDYGALRATFDEAVVRELKARPPGSRERQAFVVMGSYHCTETHYNTGVIFPGADVPETVVLDIENKRLGPKDQANATKIQRAAATPFSHLKHFPARRAGENARVPAGNEFHIYKSRFGTIAVLICSDILDNNQFMAVAAENLKNSEPIDFVLVPAYNNSDLLTSMCMQLSYLANTPVVKVNRLKQPPDAEGTIDEGELSFDELEDGVKTDMFIAGRSVRDDLIHTRYGGIISSEITDCHDDIQMLDKPIELAGSTDDPIKSEIHIFTIKKVFLKRVRAKMASFLKQEAIDIRRSVRRAVS